MSRVTWTGLVEAYPELDIDDVADIVAMCAKYAKWDRVLGDLIAARHATKVSLAHTLDAVHKLVLGLVQLDGPVSGGLRLGMSTHTSGWVRCAWVRSTCA